VVYVTGDFHADKDRFKLVKKAKLKKNDTLIVCGDFGFIWKGTNAEKKLLKWIGKRKFNTCFVDGYSDNLRLIEEYPIDKWNDGQVRTISGNLRMLMRGEVYDIDNKRIFAFGGGDNFDKEIYTTGNKLPTQSEIDNACENLAKAGNKVDYIITHDAPSKIKLFINLANSEVNYMQTFFDEIGSSVTFIKWFFGKYHLNKQITPTYSLIYTDIKPLD